MFIDRVRIFLKAGKGGDGCLSFRREWSVPLGGPDGGSGGAGGDIFLQSDPNRTTLVDFTYKPHFQAKSGGGGKGKNKQGKGAQDLIIFVPCGTVIYKNDSYLYDLVKPHEKILVAQGGRGGRGNAAFKTHRNTAPRIKEKGEPGEEAVLNLELKVIADVGLVGFPNAGKSTLLSRISAAHPKIADYPFTTLTPNLGVVKYNDTSFVIADIPGLIEGAHGGKGLGIEFLKHIERTKMLVHVIDMCGFEGKSAGENFIVINEELASYGKKLPEKPMILAMNKADLTGFKEEKDLFLSMLKKKKLTYKCFAISAVTGEGIEKLVGGIVHRLSHLPHESAPYEENGITRYTLPDDFTVEVHDSLFMVKGKKIEKLVRMTPMDLEESVKRMQHIFKKMGLDTALRRKGIRRGDKVRIGTIQFDWEE